MMRETKYIDTLNTLCSL